MPSSTPDGLDDVQRMLRDSVAGFVDRLGGARRVRGLRDKNPSFDRGAWRSMAEAGWLGMRLPEDVGGLALGFGELAVLMEQLGRGLCPEPVGSGAVLAGAVLRGAEPSERRRELLAGLAAGDLVPLLAWQETAGCYRPDAIGTRAETGRNGVALSGTKRLLPGGPDVDGFIVSARHGGDVAIFWVTAGANGLHLRTERAVDGGVVGTLILDAVSGDDAILLATGARAVAAITRAIDEARLAAAAELLGVMEAALDLTLDHVRQRTQFGKPIGSFQALQHRLVDLWTQQELTRSAVQHAIRVFEATKDANSRALAASAAKARASDAALLVTRQAIQLHGGIGYTDEADIGLFLKRALVLAAWLGNGRTQRERIAAMSTTDGGST